jgi:hypothetical protein
VYFVVSCLFLSSGLFIRALLELFDSLLTCLLSPDELLLWLVDLEETKNEKKLFQIGNP